MRFCKYVKIGPVYIYVSTNRLKGRYKHDEILRKNRKKLLRIKREKWAASDCRCEECGRRFRIEEMELHHIIPLSKNPSLVTAISNLQLVCPECHARLHGRPWGGYFPKKNHSERKNPRFPLEVADFFVSLHTKKH